MIDGTRVDCCVQSGRAAMSFEDIGRAIGITRGGAWMAYRRGMNKLRSQRAQGVVGEMCEMAVQLESGRRSSGEHVVQMGEIRRAKSRGGRA